MENISPFPKDIQGGRRTDNSTFFLSPRENVAPPDFHAYSYTKQENFI